MTFSKPGWFQRLFKSEATLFKEEWLAGYNSAAGALLRGEKSSTDLEYLISSIGVKTTLDPYEKGIKVAIHHWQHPLKARNPHG